MAQTDSLVWLLLAIFCGGHQLKVAGRAGWASTTPAATNSQMQGWLFGAGMQKAVTVERDDDPPVRTAYSGTLSYGPEHYYPGRRVALISSQG